MRSFGTSSVSEYRKIPHPIEAEAHIVSEFGRGGIEYHTKSRDFKLNCPTPHPKGADTGFHLEVRKDGTCAHCWVCDWSGTWNTLAPLLGLSPFGQDSYKGTYTKQVASTDVFGKLAAEFGSAFSLSTEDSLPPRLSPWEGDWRGLSSSFLSSVPSHQWEQRVRSRSSRGKSYSVPRILWPYMQSGKLVGYVGRRLDKEKNQKYYRAPWCSAKKVLFPFDFMLERHGGKLSYVVLVEGEVDALTMLQSDIPTLSILGSTNWSDHKRDLLLHLGVSDIFLMMDPDDAGRKATASLKKSLGPYFRSVRSIKLDEGTDPGDLSKKDLKWLRKNVFQPQH